MARRQAVGDIVDEGHGGLTLPGADVQTEDELGLRVDSQPHPGSFQHPAHTAQQFVELQDGWSLVGCELFVEMLRMCPATFKPQGHRRFIDPNHLRHISAAHPSAQQVQPDFHHLRRRLEPEQDLAVSRRERVPTRLTVPLLNVMLGPRLPSLMSACRLASVSRKYRQPGYKHA